MGFLDFLFNKERAKEKQLEKAEKTLRNMYRQTADRKYTMETLQQEESPEAVEVLLARFEETASNTTVDIDEKEYVYDILVEMARTTDVDVLGIVREHLEESDEKINWPLKVLKDLLTHEEMADVVRELLKGCEHGFQANPEKKQELMLQSTELQDRELAEALVPFLSDDNETIRFLAVDALESQGYEELMEEPMRERMCEEHSLRIVKKIAALFAEHNDWKIPESEQEEFDQALPEGFGIHKNDHVYERA